MKRALLSTALLMLGGCMVGPDYKRPDIDTPTSYRYEPQSVAKTADVEWWKRFEDPMLDEYILEALKHNRNLFVAIANVEQAAGVLTTTDSPLYPQFSYQGSGTQQKFSTRSNNVAGLIKNPQSSYQVLAGASWEIDLWGRVRRLSESARANLLATDDARRGVVLSLVTTVATTYLQLLGLDEQLAIAKNTADTYAQSLKLFELQYKHGQVSKMNVEQVRSQYETAAAQIPIIEIQIIQTENAFAVLLGRNPGPVARGKQLMSLALPAVPAGLPSELLERRPDLMQAEQTLIAANAQIGAAKAQYFPSISLTGAIGSVSTQLSDLFTGPAGAWNYGAGIAGPIFTGGAISGQVAQAEAAQRAALASYEGAIQNAFADVENALAAHTNLNNQLVAQGRLVKALSEYARLAHLQFDGGYTSYTTVLQAEQQLFPAQLNLANVRAQYYGSYVNIYKALGGAWLDKVDLMTQQPMAGGAQPTSESESEQVKQAN